MDQGPHGKPLLSFAFRKSHCESPLSQVSSRSFSLKPCKEFLNRIRILSFSTIDAFVAVFFKSS